MPNFIALGCLEVGEKFTVGWVGVVFVYVYPKKNGKHSSRT